MVQAEIIKLASKCAEKGWTYEELYYGDDLYGRENWCDVIWQYVVEYQEIGSIAFREKYKQFKLYP